MTWTYPNPKTLGRADWIYDPELDMHIPCCTARVTVQGGGRLYIGHTCGNGPLTDEEIALGRCGADHIQPPTVPA